MNGLGISRVVPVRSTHTHHPLSSPHPQSITVPPVLRTTNCQSLSTRPWSHTAHHQALPHFLEVAPANSPSNCLIHRARAALDRVIGEFWQFRLVGEKKNMTERSFHHFITAIEPKVEIVMRLEPAICRKKPSERAPGQQRYYLTAHQPEPGPISDWRALKLKTPNSTARSRNDISDRCRPYLIHLLLATELSKVFHEKNAMHPIGGRRPARGEHFSCPNETPASLRQ
jgi:hypothetical protein